MFIKNIPLFITFVDIKKVFDSIDRAIIIAFLRHYGMPDNIVSGIFVLYVGSTCKVNLRGQVSELFSITTGVSKRPAGDLSYLTHKGKTYLLSSNDDYDQYAPF